MLADDIRKTIRACIDAIDSYPFGGRPTDDELASLRAWLNSQPQRAGEWMPTFVRDAIQELCYGVITDDFEDPLIGARNVAQSWLDSQPQQVVWVPVDSLIYQSDDGDIEISDNGRRLIIDQTVDYIFASIQLPDDLRLCRRTQPAQMPQPNWSIAPENAMWWAVNPDGRQDWFPKKPVIHPKGFWAISGESFWYFGETINLPIGIDWRQTLQPRPEAMDAD